ncbi:anti-sigma factor [Flavitalea antarctica]
MNLNEYISSGIVESYVLGLADEAERAEFESMCAKHDEVRAARDAFELSLESQARVGAIHPPASVKQRLFSQLSLPHAEVSGQANNLNQNGKIDSRLIPGNSADGLDQTAQIARPGAASIDSPVREAKVVTGAGWVKFLAAASVLLLVASTILNFYLFRQYKDYSERYSSLLASQTQLANNNQALQTSLNEFHKTMSLLKDPNMTIIKMAGNLVPENGSPDPSSMATIYWNKKSSEVYLLVNALPKPTSDKQYQLWAIIDGKPVSAGVFDMDGADVMQKMANIPSAQAFAVTLEKSGGVPAPQGAMYVLGTT